MKRIRLSADPQTEREAVEALTAEIQRYDPAIEAAVRVILEDVRTEGDAAVQRYTREWDGTAPEALFVAPERIAAAGERLRRDLPALAEAFALAIDRIRSFHEHQTQSGYLVQDPIGAWMGQLVRPLARVGIYVPGGRAIYPSTVFMNVIPAQVAGVGEIVVATPPKENGEPAFIVLAACALLGVNRVLVAGGAQAVAALAYGTESVAPVDKITGPGNAYVACAKRLVYGRVDIDMIAGPSEVLVIADDSAKPHWVAADLLSQAEHDAEARAILLTPSKALADAVEKELERQVALLPKSAIAQESLRNNGTIVVVEDLTQAMRVSNAIAPEHLEIVTETPDAWLPYVQNAGSVFLGPYTPEALGDYIAGPNHTLPTGGTARFSSALGVDAFVKRTTVSRFSAEGFAALAESVCLMAREEELEAHARSVTIRMEEKA